MKIIKKVILVLVILAVVITTLLYFYNKYKNKDLTQIPEAKCCFKSTIAISFLVIRERFLYYPIISTFSMYHFIISNIQSCMSVGLSHHLSIEHLLVVHLLNQFCIYYMLAYTLLSIQVY